MTGSTGTIASASVSAAPAPGTNAAAWRRIGLVALIVFGLVLPFLVSKYQSFQLTQAMIFAIALLGLNILTGFNGQISLGHSAFFAVGAYTSAILMHRWGVPFWATLPAAALVSFVIGVLLGLPALRFEGLYLALVTLAMALAIPQLLKYFDSWTGGTTGLNLKKPFSPAGLPIDRDRYLYMLALLALIVMFWFGSNLLRGRTGRALVAIRDHPISAAAMGIDTARYKTLAFGTSALFTGVAGAMNAIVIGFVSPDSFPPFLSLSFIVGSTIGGIATVGGAVFGGLFIAFVPNWTSDISDAAPWAILGLTELIFIYLMPTGIAGYLGPRIGRWTSFVFTSRQGRKQ
jgi:branched-chain amino acid transport system permease protein